MKTTSFKYFPIAQAVRPIKADFIRYLMLIRRTFDAQTLIFDSFDWKVFNAFSKDFTVNLSGLESLYTPAAYLKNFVFNNVVAVDDTDGGHGGNIIFSGGGGQE